MTETIVLQHFRVPLDRSRSFERTITAQINRQFMRDRESIRRQSHTDKPVFDRVVDRYVVQGRPVEHIARVMKLRTSRPED